MAQAFHASHASHANRRTTPGDSSSPSDPAALSRFAEQTLADLDAQQLQDLATQMQTTHQMAVYVQSPTSGLWFPGTVSELRVDYISEYAFNSGMVVNVSANGTTVSKSLGPNTTYGPAFTYVPSFKVVPKVTLDVRLDDFPEAIVTPLLKHVALRLTNAQVVERRARLDASFEQMVDDHALGIWRP